MTQPVTIRPVSSSGALRQFIRFPFRIYRGATRYENWVPPLLIDEKTMLGRDKNPFFEHAEAAYFLAYRDGELVGRIAAVVDHNFIDYQKTKTGFFGFYESIDDRDVSDALIAQAEGWVAERGMRDLIGPVNLSTNHILGLLVWGFDEPPLVQMGYNPPYYAQLLEGYGLTKVKDLYSYKQAVAGGLSEKITRVSDLAQKRYGVELRTIDLKELDSVVETIREIYNDAWSANWGFVPWTEAEFRHLADDLKLIVIPELSLLAYIEGRPVGFALPIPDINQVLIRMNGRLLPTGIFTLLANKRKINVVRVAAMGVKKAFQNKGIDAIMVRYIQEHSTEHGIVAGDFSWILEENLPLRNMLEAWGAVHYKTHRIYGKTLKR
jgi:GNAT superfamily N-acetyltransferase